MGLVLLAACAQDPPELAVRDVWSRPTVAGPDVIHDASVPGVAYLVIENVGGADDRLISVASSVCGRAEIHVTHQMEGHMHMAAVEGGVPLPAGASVALEPGGLHIMLLELQRGLVKGDRFELELEFEHSGRQSVEAEVR
jgi:copper(I)-binding protein